MHNVTSRLILMLNFDGVLITLQESVAKLRAASRRKALQEGEMLRRRLEPSFMAESIFKEKSVLGVAWLL